MIKIYDIKNLFNPIPVINSEDIRSAINLLHDKYKKLNVKIIILPYFIAKIIFQFNKGKATASTYIIGGDGIIDYSCTNSNKIYISWRSLSRNSSGLRRRILYIIFEMIRMQWRRVNNPTHFKKFIMEQISDSCYKEYHKDFSHFSKNVFINNESRLNEIIHKGRIH